MKIIGCDYHPSGQQVFGIDTESGEGFADRWIAHTGNELEEFYGHLRKQKHDRRDAELIARLLITHPGIGPVISLAFVSNGNNFLAAPAPWRCQKQVDRAVVVIDEMTTGVLEGYHQIFRKIPLRYSMYIAAQHIST